MSMLAERKRKTKWIINPTKKPLWTTDSNGIKFGKGLMEKMGWSAGKGLGANEQGIQEPLKVLYKNDTKGMGFKGNDDEWIEHQDEFNLLLDKLRNESCVSKTSESEKNEIQSLEEKSKLSRARVHYQKFMRGKDLSRYSENDLACILGTNKLNKKKAQIEEDIHTDLNNDSNFETSFGVTTINSGSIQNYFKKKWVSHKKTTEKFSEIDGNSVESFPSGKFNFLDSFKSKAEKEITNEQYELQSEVNILELNKNETSESEKCKKKKKNTVQIEPAEKRRKENSDDCILKNDTLNDVKYYLDDKKEDMSMKNENLKFNLKRKKTKNKNDEIFEVKKKKRKLCSENSENFHKEYLNEELDDTRKCKRTDNKDNKDNKDIKNNGSCRMQCEPLDKSISEQVSYKKENKKFKKKKLEDNEEIKDTNFCNDQNGELIKLGSKIKSSEDKKEKEKSKDFKKSKRVRFSSSSDSLPNNENGEVDLEVESSKKEEEEDKKEMSEDNDKIKEFSNNFKIFSNSQNNEVIELGCEAKSSNKKKRKKEERKKSEHNEQIRDTKFYSNNQNSEVIELCSVIKSNKGKKKKKKKLKDYEGIEDRQYSSFPNTLLSKENSLEVESAVKKKNKTNKRENLVRNKDIGDENSDSNKVVYANVCNIGEKINSSDEENGFVKSGNKKVKTNHSDLIEEVYLVEGFKEKKISNELTNILEVDSSKKKKKKDQQEELTDALNRENMIEEPVEKKDQTQIRHAKKSSKGRRLTDSNNVRNDESAEGGVHQHKLEFLNEKRADKFYSGQYTNHRVQRLLCWVNFSEFKGSNLENVTGYGRLLKCENKPR